MPSPVATRPEPDNRTGLAAYERARQQCERRPTDANLARLWGEEQRHYREILKPGRVDLDWRARRWETHTT